MFGGDASGCCPDLLQSPTMPSEFVDLHCHSTASDGTLSPTQVVQLAHRAGLTALALTDHDTIGGVGEAASAAGSLGIDFLPGIEISCEFPHPGTMHLLGYGVDPDSKVLHDLTRQLIDARDNRNPKIIAKLNELRSEERRVGKECRSWWSSDQ